MGAPPPTPPGEDPHANAAWTDTPVEVLLEQARLAVSGGDVPRATSLLDGLRRRPSLSEPDQAEAWALWLEISVMSGDRVGADAAVDELAELLPIPQVRQHIRMVWVRHRADAPWENALLTRAEAGGGAGTDEPSIPVERTSLLDSRYGGGVPGGNGADTPPADSVLRLLDAIRAHDDEGDEVGEPDPDAVRLFSDGLPLYEPEELRSPVEGTRAAALLREEDDGEHALPLLAGAELASLAPADVHRVVADHPGVSGRDLLRRYALEQARRTSPAELQHSYDMGIEFFGQESFEEAAHLLLPVATIPNRDRVGALELLTRALYELGRLNQAEAYLKEGIPVEGRITEPAYAPLFYWLARISEDKDDAGSAIEYYALAVKLDPGIVEAKRRLVVLLGL